MNWYQSQSAIPPAYKKILEAVPPPPLPDILNCQQFCTQLAKNGNMQILSWVENNYAYFFQQLLKRCLVLPSESDSQMRKYREPTQAISLLCSIIDVIAGDKGGMGGIAGSMSGSVVASTVGNGGKVTSPQIIAFIIQKMFVFYMQNNPKNLLNTLIPGYFNRIFECLNRSHSAILTHTLRTSPNCRLQKLLQIHGQFEQISKCIQSILIVFITHTTVNTNLQMSVTSPAHTTMPITGNNAGMGLQQNHPYELKYRLLMSILQKLTKEHKKMNLLLLENFLSILLEVVKNVYVIFQGNTLTDYICQTDVMKIIFSIALGQLKDKQYVEGTQCQPKGLELLKYCIGVMTAIDRSNISNHFVDVLNQILGSQKPNIVTALMLQLVNEWFLAQSGQQTSLFVNLNNRSMCSSMNSSNSLSNSQNCLKAGQICPQIQKALLQNFVFKRLIRLCIANPSCNIFQQRVANFISSIFKFQNSVIIDCIYKENDIIKETINKLTNFKENPYFGYFIFMIKIYTSRRIDTPTVKQMIQLNIEVWNKFYLEILEPHVFGKMEIKLGQIPSVLDAEPLPYTVVKLEQESRRAKTVQQISDKKVLNTDIPSINRNQKDKEQNSEEKSNINEQNLVPIELNLEKVSSQKGKDTQELIQPISLKLTKKQSQNTEQKNQTESFQSFLKKKMGESNKLVDERRNKSRTPTKMAGQTKRKKWGTENETQTQPKKTISADNKSRMKVVSAPLREQLQKKLLLIKLSKTQKLGVPKKMRERKINPQNDNILMKLIQRAKAGVKMIR